MNIDRLIDNEELFEDYIKALKKYLFIREGFFLNDRLDKKSMFEELLDKREFVPADSLDANYYNSEVENFQVDLKDVLIYFILHKETMVHFQDDPHIDVWFRYAYLVLMNQYTIEETTDEECEAIFEDIEITNGWSGDSSQMISHLKSRIQRLIALNKCNVNHIYKMAEGYL